MVNGKWLPDFIERLKASAWHQLYLPLLPLTHARFESINASTTLTVLNSNFLQLGRRSGGRPQPTVYPRRFTWPNITNLTVV